MNNLNRKIWNRIKICILILLIIILLGGCASKFSENSSDTNKKTSDLVIDIPDPCTYGSITVYDKYVETFSYTGEIKILNDGINGEPIEIVVDVQNNGD